MSWFKRWWIAHFTGFTNREKWGYGVWLVFGVIVFVPEIWAAKWPDSAWWPTVSGTVGELEYWHPEVALAVVFVTALFAYSALRYPAQRLEGDDLLPNRTSDTGRLTASTEPLKGIGWVLYFAIALTIICVGTGIAVWRTDLSDEFAVGRTLYALIAVFWVIIPSLLAWPPWGRDVPFPTLFETMRSLERRLRLLALVVAAGLAILLLHLVFYPWPATIPDIKDLHTQYEKQGPRHKDHPPQPTSP
jgi:hypothetical protein